MGVEEEQQIAVLGEVVVVAESLVKMQQLVVLAGGALEWRWRGGVAVARWSCGGAVELWWRGGVVVARRHAWPGHGGGRW